ncbi:MAG: WD40 repeat domain-containing protein [Calditrichae bacterium]|nr:WD40 repeat domain-containing protein [Calditrichia bacterium]
MTKIATELLPYPGLRPFESNENFLFFGRDGQSNELLARLRNKRFLAVVGPSGSGKSSLVRAGLLPDILGGMMAGAGSHWRVTIMRPGGNPIGNLAEALNRPGILNENGGGDTMQSAFTLVTLQRSALGIAEAYRQAGLPEKDNLLLVVDQFEELFRFKEAATVENAPDLAAAFVKLLLNAVAQQEFPIYVIITMRSDFLGDCAQFRDLPEAINDSQYLVPRMTRDERREAITGPAAVGGARMTPRLVQRLLNDVGDNPDHLPILQHALMRTWNHWKDHHQEKDPIDLDDYRDIGGMEAALSRHADEAFESLGEGISGEAGRRRKEIAEKLFKFLTEKGSDNRETRRPAKLKDIAVALEADISEVVEIIDEFRKPGRSFLMPPPGETLTPDTLIDISHESLIRNWQRLKSWVNEEARSAYTYRRVAETALLYQKNEAGLLQDPELQIALTWRQNTDPNKTWAARYHPAFDEAMRFLDQSREKRDADAAAERERQRRERLRNRRYILILIIALSLALAGGIFSLVQWRLAVAQEKRANFNLARIFEEKAGVALANGQENRDNEQAAEALKDFDQAWLYTLWALNQDIGDDQWLPISLGRLLHPEMPPYREAQRQLSDSLRHRAGNINSVIFSPDGALLAYAAEKGIGILSADGKTFQRTLKGHEGTVWKLAFSPDSRQLASASSDATIRIWDVASGELKHRLAYDDDDVWSVAFSPDGHYLASAHNYGEVCLWNLAYPDSMWIDLSGHRLAVRAVAFSPDSRRLASASSDATIRIWDVPSGTPLDTLSAHHGDVWSLAFSPDGYMLASGASDSTVLVWDTENYDAPRYTLRGHKSDVWSVAFTPDSRHLISGSEDRKMIIWDVAAGFEAPLAILGAHRQGVLGVAVSPDGALLASGGVDKDIHLINFRLPLADMESWDVINDPFNIDHYYDLKQSYLESLNYEMEEANLELIARTDNSAESLLVAYQEEPAVRAPASIPANTSDTGIGQLEEEPVIANKNTRTPTLARLSLPTVDLSENEWDYFSFNNPGYPTLKASGRELTLLPDQRYKAAQAVFFKKEVSPPFKIEFEYNIYHAGESFSKGGARPGAGLVFMFMKNPTVYAGLANPDGNSNAYATQQTRAISRQTPEGENRGFIPDGVGYGVHFSLYNEQTIDLKDGYGKLLESYRFDERKKSHLPAVYSDGAWRTVTIDITNTTVTVTYEGEVVIRWEGKLAQTPFNGIGFGAASTIYTGAEHSIRNVRLISKAEMASWKEREGFEYLIKDDFVAAQRAFLEAEQLYPGYHQVYEIARLLRVDGVKAKTEADRKIIYETIILKLSYRAPGDLLEQLRAKLR